MTAYLVFTIMYENNKPYIDYMSLCLYLSDDEVLKKAEDIKRYSAETYILPLLVDDEDVINALKEGAHRV